MWFTRAMDARGSAIDAAALLGRLWREGAAIDDRAAIAAARDSLLDVQRRDELAVFADWLAADDGSAAGVEPALTERLIGDPAAELLILAIELRAAVLRRDHAAIDLALVAVDGRLADPAGGGAPDARWTTARAAAELALAEAALYAQDPEAAESCLEPVAESGPPALRIAAVMRQTSVALARADLDAARARARQALDLAHAARRPRQAEQAQLLFGLVACAAGDAGAMRSALRPLVEASTGAPLIRLLTAGLEDPDEALAMLGDGVRIAAERGDAAGYALCALVGARRYVALGRRPDALVTMSAVRIQLAQHAPQLAAVLDAEVHAWRDAWGPEAFAEAERAAVAAID